MKRLLSVLTSSITAYYYKRKKKTAHQLIKESIRLIGDRDWNEEDSKKDDTRNRYFSLGKQFSRYKKFNFEIVTERQSTEKIIRLKMFFFFFRFFFLKVVHSKYQSKHCLIFKWCTSKKIRRQIQLDGLVLSILIKNKLKKLFKKYQKQSQYFKQNNLVKTNNSNYCRR